MPGHLHCGEVRGSKLKTLLFRHAKIQTVNVDGFGFVLMPKGLHHAETAREAKEVDGHYV